MGFPEEEWVRVGGARHVGEAALLRHALEAHEIEVRTRGEHLPSIMGELPVIEAAIELWVRREDAGRAAALLEGLERADGGGEWGCPACGEANPEAFDECWSCHRGRPRR